MRLKNRSFFGKVENIVGKAENAGYQHFLLFPPCLQKSGLCGKELMLYQTPPNFDDLEIIAGKEENADNLHFVLFQQHIIII